MQNITKLIKQLHPVSIAIGIAVLIVYVPTLGGGFSWDERSVFADGRSDYYVEFFESSFARPMTNALFGFESLLWGDASMPYHLINIILHLLNAFAVYVLCVKLADSRRAGMIAAALFALYPGATEAVSWVWGRAELFKTLFFNVAFISYIEYRREGEWQALASSALFFLLALLSGQGALALVIVVVAFDLSVEQQTDRRRVLWAVLGYLGAFAIYMLLLPGKGEFFPLRDLNPGRLYEALSALGYYTLKLIAPIAQSILPEVQSSTAYVMLSMLLPALTGLLFWDGRRMVGMLLLVSFLSMIPVAFVVFHGFKYPFGFRYLYMPASVLCILAGLMLDRIKSEQVYTALIAVLCLAFAAVSLSRTLVWSSPSSVWEDAVAKSRRYPAAIINHAASMYLAGHPGEANASVARAFSRVDMSYSEFHRASKLYIASNGYRNDEEYIKAVSATANMAKAYYGLGYVYYNEFADGKKDPRMLEKARGYLTQALDLAPEMAGTNYHLGLIYLQLEEVDKAEHHFGVANSVNHEGLFVSDIKYFLDGLNEARAKGLLPPKIQNAAH